MIKILKRFICICCFIILSFIIVSKSAFADNIYLYKNENYNREKAREYALKWAISSNKEYYNFINDGGDCTNFVSQVLKAGGIEFVGSKINATNTNSWFYYSANLPNRSSTWTAAQPFSLHFGKEHKRAYKYREYIIKEALINFNEIYKTIYIGDIVQYSRPNNIVFHSQAITDVLNKETIYFSQHSNSIENFYKDGNLKYYLLGKPDNYNFIIYTIKEEKQNIEVMNEQNILLTEEEYRKELIEAINIVKISLNDTRFDNEEYKNISTNKFIENMNKKINNIELKIDFRNNSYKELLEELMDRSDI